MPLNKALIVKVIFSCFIMIKSTVPTMGWNWPWSKTEAPPQTEPCKIYTKYPPAFFPRSSDPTFSIKNKFKTRGEELKNIFNSDFKYYSVTPGRIIFEVFDEKSRRVFSCHESQKENNGTKVENCPPSWSLALSDFICAMLSRQKAQLHISSSKLKMIKIHFDEKTNTVRINHDKPIDVNFFLPLCLKDMEKFIESTKKTSDDFKKFIQENLRSH